MKPNCTVNNTFLKLFFEPSKQLTIMKPNCKTNSPFLKLFFLIIAIGSFNDSYAQVAWKYDESLRTWGTDGDNLWLNKDNNRISSSIFMSSGNTNFSQLKIDEKGDFHIMTNGNTFIPGGNVGIGVSSPLAKLHVNGQIRSNEAYINSNGGIAYFGNTGNFAVAQGPAGGTIVNATKGAQINLSIANVPQIIVKDEGIVFKENIYVQNVGLGTNYILGPTLMGGGTYVPGTALTVDGRVYISEDGGKEKGFVNKNSDNFKSYLLWVEEGVVAKDFAVAKITQWPDYVFNKDYKLNNLKEVDTFIKDNGHLPTMPSAKEVEENGLTVSDITKRTVKTVEELTLHAIEQQKLIENQAQLIESLMKRLTKLETNK